METAVQYFKRSCWGYLFMKHGGEGTLGVADRGCSDWERSRFGGILEQTLTTGQRGFCLEELLGRSIHEAWRGKHPPNR